MNFLTSKNYDIIDWKILVKESESDGAIHMIWNLFENLGVISFLPPPGGAAESIVTVFPRLFQLRSFLS